MVLDKLTTTASQNISNKFIYHYFYVLVTSEMKKHFALEVLTQNMDYAISSHAYACIGLMFEELQYRFTLRQSKEAYDIQGDY